MGSKAETGSLPAKGESRTGRQRAVGSWAKRNSGYLVAAVVLGILVIVGVTLAGLHWVAGARAARAEAALAEGRYADAVKDLQTAAKLWPTKAMKAKLDEASSLLSADFAYTQAMLAIQAKDYASAYDLLSRIGDNYPKQEEVKSALETARKYRPVQNLAKSWGATVDWSDLSLDFSQPGRGMLTVYPTGTFQPDGAVDFTLTYVPPAGGSGFTYPELLSFREGDQYPARFVGEAGTGEVAVLVQGHYLWRPPGEPEDLLALTGEDGYVRGWSVDSAGKRLAVCYRVRRADQTETFDTVVIDLGTRAVTRVGSYAPGSSRPEDWQGEPVKMEWTADGTLRYESYAGADVSWVEWRP